MATYNITIKNTGSVASSVDVDTIVISPSGITTPTTPYAEFVSDMTSVAAGTLLIPAFNRLQYIVVPVGGTATFEVTDYREAAYYQNMKFDDVEITVTPEVVTVEETESTQG